jgi:hypothetical protein
LLIANGVEDVKVTFHLLVDVENRRDVSASVAVVGCGPDGDEVLVLEPVSEAVHHELMGAGDQLKVVDVVEFGSDTGSEEPASASWGESPSLNLFWIGPHEVAEGALVRDLHTAFEQADLVEGLDVWGEATVDAEDLSFNDGADTEEVEHFGAVFPGVGVSVLSDRLVVEAVDGGDLAGLVVSAQQRDAAWVLELQAQEQLEGLDGVVATINEVAHENITSVGDLTSFFEKFEQVVELAVNVTTNGHWGAHWLHIALLDEDLLDLLTQDAQVALWEDLALLHSCEPGFNVAFAHCCVFRLVS